MDPCREHPARRWRDGRFTAIRDDVIAEARVELVVNDNELRLAMLCLPDCLPELAVGFLRGEGALARREDIEAIEVASDPWVVGVRGRFDPDALDAIRRRWTWGTGCGGGGTSASLNPDAYQPVGEGPFVPAGKIVERARAFQRSFELFRRTGGAHACALATADEVLVAAEDVGRHNAFDKVLGKAFLADIDTRDKMMLTTGRLSAEMVSKAVASRLPIVVGRSAVTALSIDLARRYGMTLVGFARAGRFNVYTGFQRILADPAG